MVSPRIARGHEISMRDKSEVIVQTASATEIVESIVGCKWAVQILWLLFAGHRRPSVLLRECPGLSAKVMNERLRKMQQFRVVDRTALGTKPPLVVEYSLTPIGHRFISVLREVSELQKSLDVGNPPASDDLAQA